MWNKIKALFKPRVVCGICGKEGSCNCADIKLAQQQILQNTQSQLAQQQQIQIDILKPTDSGKFGKAEDGKQKCSYCKRYIPKHIKRVSFEISRYNTTSLWRRVCGSCLVKLAKSCNKKDIREWESKVIAEEL